MAIRTIVLEGDEALDKVCRPVENFDGRLATLLDDLAETMYDADGCGLAAPQVSVLRRICVIDAGEGLIELVNPLIIKCSGEQYHSEGCLSCPGDFGVTKRPAKVTVKAFNRFGKEFTITGDGLLARALCHEIDHLDGLMFKSRLVKEEA